MLPDGVLSLEAEQEARGEVLDILHAELVVGTDILLKVS